MTIPVLIDCDPGHDDAIALLLALASPELEVLGVTTVGGNAPLEKTTINALKVLELIGRSDIEVAAGFARPLYRPLQIAANVHGESGLDGPVLPDPSIEPVDLHAVDFLAQKILDSSGPVTLIPVGPLTNIAGLLNSYPDVIDGVERIVLDGWVDRYRQRHSGGRVQHLRRPRSCPPRLSLRDPGDDDRPRRHP